MGAEARGAREQIVAWVLPPGTKDRVARAAEVFQYRRVYARMREDGMIQYVTPPPFQEVTFGPLAVTAIPVLHIPEATALRSVCAGAVIAYSGDTVARPGEL